MVEKAPSWISAPSTLEARDAHLRFQEEPLPRSARLELLRPVLKAFMQATGEERTKMKLALEIHPVLGRKKHGRPRSSRQQTAIREQKWKEAPARVARSRRIEAADLREVKIALLARSVRETQKLRRKTGSEISQQWEERQGEVDPFLLFICYRSVSQVVAVLNDKGLEDLEKYFDCRSGLWRQVEAGEIAPGGAFDQMVEFNRQADFEPTTTLSPLVREITEKFAFYSS